MSSPHVIDAEIARHLPTVSAVGVGLDDTGRAIEEMFPKIDPQFVPFGTRILVQIKRVVARTKSGIYLGEDTKETEAWNQQIGQVISIGDLAFKNRANGNPWPEGAWAKPGDYVRFLRHVGDRMVVKDPDGLGPVAVLVLNDSDLLGKYTGDPREVRAYLL